MFGGPSYQQAVPISGHMYLYPSKKAH